MYSHKIWHDGRYGQSATCRNAIFDLYQNPRWRPAAILKKMKIAITAAISARIFTIFGMLVATDSPQRSLKSFFNYDKIKSEMAAGHRD